jgi:metallo-beta-lactamase family protein
MDVGLTFYGAVGTVTGSRFLLRVGHHRTLIDCGLFQGYKNLRKRNWAGLPIPPSKIDEVVLTHAHIDHSGFLPVLCREGFKNDIFCTHATRDLCRHLLPDSGFIHEKDAASANRHGHTRHHPARPLYTREDAENCLPQFHPLDFASPRSLSKHHTMTFRRAGHIPGAASVLFEAAGKRILFSGDLGPPDSPTMTPPDPIPQVDVLIIESTYGNRLRDRTDPETALAEVVNRTASRGGTLIIPAFAVGRTQLILHHLQRLISSGRVPQVPVFLDSPLAIKATEVFENHPDDHRLTVEEAEAACSLPRYVRDPEESKALTRDPMPKIIIAGSGMATGGRVLHHLKAYLPDGRNTILFAGFQAAGTRGAKMIQGVESIKIHGSYWPVNAEVDHLDMLSAHADSAEIIDWLRPMPNPPRQIFIVHGEPEASEALRIRMAEELDWVAEVPELNEEYLL